MVFIISSKFILVSLAFIQHRVHGFVAPTGSDPFRIKATQTAASRRQLLLLSPSRSPLKSTIFRREDETSTSDQPPCSSSYSLSAPGPAQMQLGSSSITITGDIAPRPASQVHNPAATNTPTKKAIRGFSRFGLPLFGLLCGPFLLSTNNAIMDILKNGVPFSPATMGVILLMGGICNKVGDEIDDEGLFTISDDAHPVHRKISSPLLSLALHMGTLTAFFSAMMWKNCVPAAFLTSMYAYGWIVGGKADLSTFRQKPSEALVVLMCSIPFWGAIGMKMVNSGLFASVFFTSFASTVAWLKLEKGFKSVAPLQRWRAAITESGVFRTLPTALLLLLPTLLLPPAQTSSLLIGTGVFHLDTLGYSGTKQFLKRFGSMMTKYGMVICSMLWLAAYCVYGKCHLQPFPSAVLTYNLTWEWFFTIHTTFLEKDRSQGGERKIWRAIAPAVWLAGDIFMTCRAGYSRSHLMEIFGAMTFCMGGLTAMSKLGVMGETQQSLLKYSSWPVCIALTASAQRLAITTPCLGSKLGLGLMAMANLAGACRTLSKYNGSAKKMSFMGPLTIVNSIQSMFALLSLALT